MKPPLSHNRNGDYVKNRTALLGLFCAALAVGPMIPVTARAADYTPAELAVYKAIAPDPPPPRLASNRHFFAGNERGIGLFLDGLARKGGVFIGVGTDQNYLLAGWCQPELLVLMDFDPMIPDLHRLYGLFFSQATDGQALTALFKPDDATARQVTALLDDQIEDPAERSRLAKVYRRARKDVYNHLLELTQELHDAGIASFLDDLAQYRSIATLFATGRVITLRGDLTLDGAFRHLARALEAHKRTVSYLYVSNAEAYFRYGPEFRQNIHALPIAADSLLLRTIPYFRSGGHRWTYATQTISRFKEFICRKQISNWDRVLGGYKKLAPMRDQPNTLLNLQDFPPEKWQTRHPTCPTE